MAIVFLENKEIVDSFSINVNMHRPKNTMTISRRFLGFSYYKP